MNDDFRRLRRWEALLVLVLLLAAFALAGALDLADAELMAAGFAR